MRIGGSVRAVAPAVHAPNGDAPSGDAPILDGVPVFEEAPLRAVEFAPGELRPRSRRGHFVAAAWAIAVGSLVGVGLLASDPAAEGPRSPIAEVASPPPVGGHWPPDIPSTRMGALLLGQVIEIDSPAPARVEVTTPRVSVSGTVLVRAARVRIALEARGNRVLDHLAVIVADPDGGVRPEWAPTFEASFDLPFPRPNGTMWVVVTAYDERGMPLGATRRPFTVGALREPAVQLADSNRMAERWRPPVPRGPSRAALAIPPPLCLPVSAILASSC